MCARSRRPSCGRSAKRDWYVPDSVLTPTLIYSTRAWYHQTSLHAPRCAEKPQSHYNHRQRFLRKGNQKSADLSQQDARGPHRHKFVLVTAGIGGSPVLGSRQQREETSQLQRRELVARFLFGLCFSWNVLDDVLTV